VIPNAALRDLFALAYLDGLERRQAAQQRPAQRIPLDDTDRAPVVPLRPAGGDHA
jgi:hypothetical protein